MKPEVGSILGFATTTGLAAFSDDTSEWTEPMVGFATVVNYIKDDEYETQLETVILDQGIPIPLSEYLRDHDGARLSHVKITGGTR